MDKKRIIIKGLGEDIVFDYILTPDYEPATIPSPLFATPFMRGIRSVFDINGREGLARMRALRAQMEMCMHGE